MKEDHHHPAERRLPIIMMTTRRRRRRKLLLATMTVLSIILSVHYYHHYDAVAATVNTVSSSSSPPPMEEEGSHRQRIMRSKSGYQEETTILSSTVTTSENNHLQHHHHHQQQQRQLEECYKTENNWHLAMKGKNTCTNSLYFPPAWTSPSMSSFFKPNCLECCEQMFPKLDPSLCICEDVCNQGQVEEEEPCTEGPCCDRYWHPDLTAQQPYTCTNTYTDDGTYPPYWNDNPLMVGTAMFKTFNECCTKLTNGDVTKCVKIEAEECKITTTGGDGQQQQQQCSSGAKCFEAGSICTEGTETCCGETHDSLMCECSDDGNGGLSYDCHFTDACTKPSCCRGPPPSKDLFPPPSPDTCQSVGQLCDTGIADDFCCEDDSSSGGGSTYCTKSGGKEVVADDESDSGTADPSPRPTLYLTIPPHLLRPDETPRPTLLITIPPHLLRPNVTPRPTLRITIPPHLLKPPTTPPQQQPQQDMVPNSSPLQDDCSKILGLRRCNSYTGGKCKWVAGVCRAAAAADSITTNTCTVGFKWHRGKPSQGSTCSNDLDYPRAWDDPQVTASHLFDTPEKCCLVHFTLETCTAINACGVHQTLSSFNCSGYGRGRCKLDANCSWKPAPDSICVATTTMQQTSSAAGSQATKCSGYTWRQRACNRDPSCTWSTQVNACVLLPSPQ